MMAAVPKMVPKMAMNDVDMGEMVAVSLTLPNMT